MIVWMLLIHVAKSLQKEKNATKNRHMATPVTISALSMGMFVMDITREYSFFRIASIPIQASNPMTVAIKAEPNARIKVLRREVIMVVLEKISAYQFNVNPPQTTLDLELLKDETISTIMGA